MTDGGVRSVWMMTQLGHSGDIDATRNKFVVKTNRRGYHEQWGKWGPAVLERMRHDVMVSERAGDPLVLEAPSVERRPMPTHSNVLPVYRYCAFTSVAPFAEEGTLLNYLHDRRAGRSPLSAKEQYALALQAARGLRRAQLFLGGKATNVHGDLTPQQYLVFEKKKRPQRGKEDDRKKSLPTLLLNDFNQGAFLTRSSRTNETCPFRKCHDNHRFMFYRSPEELRRCDDLADQTDAIDVFALGGILYYLLSDGHRPWYHLGSASANLEERIRLIRKGETPRLPPVREYASYGNDASAMVERRSRHPAFVTLKGVMEKCWALRTEERPSAEEVVRLLEEGWRSIVEGASKPVNVTSRG
ncbi:hypothetical protein ACHAWF_004052 [Thalassiosira exigua]